MNTNMRNILLLAGLALAFASCKKDDASDDPPATNEEELITTVILTFTDQETASQVFVMRFTDLDGPGGSAPVITADTLPANRAYNMAVRVLNESASPVQEITSEIASEALEHQLFFRITGAALTTAYADADGAGNPIGLANTAITGVAGAGTLLVTLRHEPNKSGAGVSGGDITNAGGETDVEVSLPVVIE